MGWKHGLCGNGVKHPLLKTWCEMRSASRDVKTTSPEDLMQFADQQEPALLQPPFCCECKHYQGDDEGEPMCFRGVHFGTARVTSVSAKTMRSDSWWGNEACGKEGRHWEEKG